jgi:hypothetical protein
MLDSAVTTRVVRRILGDPHFHARTGPLSSLRYQLASSCSPPFLPITFSRVDLNAPSD